MKVPPRPDRLGIPETMSGTTPGKFGLVDLVIVCAAVVVVLACVVVVFAAVEGKL